LHTGSVPGLGHLIPEVERTRLYLAKRDVKEGHFARTVAEPHSPTRFFPSALKLDRDQLITLHIHEGLHRALAASIRSDEGIVGKIALAITSPEATTDRISTVMKEVTPAPEASIEAGDDPTFISYGIHQYFGVTNGPAARVNRLHVASLQLPSLKTGRFFLRGLVQASLVEADGSFGSGPLRFEPRLTFVPRPDYEISLWVGASFLPVADSPWALAFGGRDVYTAGLGARKALRLAFVDLRVASALVRGTVPTGNFARVLNARLGAGVAKKSFTLGAFAELHIADTDPIGIPSFTLWSVGPEATFYFEDDLSLLVGGRLKLAATNDGNFDSLGDLVVYGAGQGHLSIALRYGL